MNRKIAPFIDIVRLEDKETKLKAFIRTVVEQAASCAKPEGEANVLLLIARSVESPVAKAVASLVREGAIATPLRTILALMPRPDCDAAAVETFTALTGSHGGQLIRDLRLFDAHEQIVLGPAASWVGDCMRRDPMKRDAYECYAADCAKTAGWARTSHERLWAVCEPMPELVLAPREPAAVEMDGTCVAMTGAEAETPADPLGSNSN
jgi:hypothetical protein